MVEKAHHIISSVFNFGDTVRDDWPARSRRRDRPGRAAARSVERARLRVHSQCARKFNNRIRCSRGAGLLAFVKNAKCLYPHAGGGSTIQNRYHDIFEQPTKVHTPYRKLEGSEQWVSRVEGPGGKSFLSVEPEAITALVRESMTDIAHLLSARPARCSILLCGRARAKQKLAQHRERYFCGASCRVCVSCV